MEEDADKPAPAVSCSEDVVCLSKGDDEGNENLSSLERGKKKTGDDMEAKADGSERREIPAEAVAGGRSCICSQPFFAIPDLISPHVSIPSVSCSFTRRPYECQNALMCVARCMAAGLVEWVDGDGAAPIGVSLCTLTDCMRGHRGLENANASLEALSEGEGDVKAESVGGIEPHFALTAKVQAEGGPADGRRALDFLSSFTIDRKALFDMPRFMGFPCAVKGVRERGGVETRAGSGMEASVASSGVEGSDGNAGKGEGQEKEGSMTWFQRMGGRFQPLVARIEGPREERRRERGLLLFAVTLLSFDLLSDAVVAGIMLGLGRETPKFHWFGITVAVLTVFDLANVWLIREDSVNNQAEGRGSGEGRIWGVRLAMFCLSLSEIAILVLTVLTLESHKGVATLVLSIITTVLGVLWKLVRFVLKAPCRGLRGGEAKLPKRS
uniref:Uncharacterized protein n=1 Tax=Chromera velia CCMP2878 TaxID=1169474 RepID=A0A0G4HND1_9ALVE|eukprot:Cvel_29442.t1-p1 / transcript=Cvel_29442.t1 / gene=Cvel_29442 / organism=Chromera_velia_CCMP2878 / gene_product=hypothetical protein / transcript_product=hypothetical protein / location=Cvel_scaffold4023:7510-9974(-) / protein_length=439 / sequence_SO=supercontig / SO=protein_coding / is_pseudo=false